MKILVETKEREKKVDAKHHQIYTRECVMQESAWKIGVREQHCDLSMNFTSDHHHHGIESRRRTKLLCKEQVSMSLVKQIVASI